MSRFTQLLYHFKEISFCFVQLLILLSSVSQLNMVLFTSLRLSDSFSYYQNTVFHTLTHRVKTKFLPNLVIMDWKDLLKPLWTSWIDASHRQAVAAIKSYVLM